jgi:hypothetical protein
LFRNSHQKKKPKTVQRIKVATFYMTVLVFLLVVYLFLYSSSRSASIAENQAILESFDQEILKKQGDNNGLTSGGAANLTFDEQCDLQGEWERIGRLVFIKRTAVYYFSDAELLTIHKLKESSFDFKLTVHIVVYETLNNVTINQLASSYSNLSEIKTKHSKFYEYSYSVISLNVHPARLNISARSENIKMYVKLVDYVTRRETKGYLPVKIKTLTTAFSSKKSAMICSKCYFINRQDDYMSFRWWVDLNRRIGYQKISICNHSISNEPSFRNLFETYKEFMILSELKCIPNLQNPTKNDTEDSVYFKSFSDLIGTNGTYS